MYVADEGWCMQSETEHNLRLLCITCCSMRLHSCLSIICFWIIRVQKQRCWKYTKWTSSRFKQFAHLTAAWGFKFCSSLLYSGGSTMRCLKERDRTVAICGIWIVKPLWNTIERSPSQSLICRASNQLRFRSLLNYFWASQFFVSESAQVVCDFY